MARKEVYEILKEHEGEKLTVSQIRILFRQKYGRSISSQAIHRSLRALWSTDWNVHCERQRGKGNRILLVYWYAEGEGNI